MKKTVVAFDFGASSGRAIAGTFQNGRLEYKEVHRFDNIPVDDDGRMCHNFPAICKEVDAALSKMNSADGLSFDTWGVDYGLLNKSGNLLRLPCHYRDTRTAGTVEKVLKKIPADNLYRATGNQIMEINTLFQLICDQESGRLDDCEVMLPMPDLFAYLLTGTVSTESGTDKGTLSPAVQQRLGLPAIRVAAVCGHDTQCAAFAAPAKTERHIFLSCGTWSLFGTELEQPVLTEQAAALALSNEVGYGRKVTLLKNIIGLWLLQESRREYARQGENYSFAEIETMARQCHEPSCYIDPDDPVFTPSGNIPQRVQAYCRKTGQHIPETPGAVFRCIYESLALKYSRALEDLEACTGAHYPVIHMLGGGVKDGFLCQLTADFCQRQVTAGPVEATVYGNAAIQLLNLNAIETPDAARRCIAASETMRNYHPGTYPASIYSKKTSKK